jgi:hypothetical protein
MMTTSAGFFVEQVNLVHLIYSYLYYIRFSPSNLLLLVLSWQATCSIHGESQVLFPRVNRMRMLILMTTCTIIYHRSIMF